MRDRAAELMIRPREPADDPFIASLCERVFARYSGEPAASVARMIGESGAETAVALAGRTRVGFAIVAFQRLGRDFGPWSAPSIARLNAIAVRPDAEGRGVGRRLLAWAEALSQARGAVVLTLSTAESNARARRLFTSSGFLSATRLPDTYEGGRPGVAMFKLISS